MLLVHRVSRPIRSHVTRTVVKSVCPLLVAYPDRYLSLCAYEPSDRGTCWRTTSVQNNVRYVHVCHSQGRDGLVKVWDTERLLARSSAAESDASWRDGDDEGTAQRQQKQPSTSHGKNGSAQSGTSNPEPVLERVTGAFHFCQFALTRWREEVIPTASESETDRQGYRRELFDDCKGCVDDDAGRGGDDDRPRRTDVHDTGQAAMGDGAERNLSSGSFAENAMLAPSHEQHSVSLSSPRDESKVCACLYPHGGCHWMDRRR